ncbi:hypothetical protein B1A75_14930 [Geobacillus sp. LEMMY01]|nr:hypothetical protein B1A75_14930 [Geobacillus sp. LEMMY01]
MVSQERKQCVAAAAGPKRREPMAAGTRQYEKWKRRVFFRRLSSFEGMNFLLDIVCFSSIINDVKIQMLA